MSQLTNSSSAQSAFKQDFVNLVESFGLSSTYGLADAHLRPSLPDGDHVYLETEDLGARTLSVKITHRAQMPPHVVNTQWKVAKGARSGERHLVPIAPCVHTPPVATDGANHMPKEHAAFAEAFVALVSRHGMDEQFALSRLHRHFGMDDHEVLVESVTRDDRIHIDVVPRLALTDEIPIQWQVGPMATLQPTQYVARGSW